ncbi:Gfo/Idh/MocA family oxidoreductase [Janibacter alkaliphilus]|uniref:Putative dehydrogenase n=1 Tax=Janibacter alkaliphilus TaxID=1069963 RepID=A0A852X0M8_9MICO|nr:putative dehydrogenase [Janibacter alkaliphilus]
MQASSTDKIEPTSGPTSATLPASRRPDPAEVPGLRWGVLGAGWIAGQMIRSLGSTRQQVVAVGSREQARAADLATTYGVPQARAHGSYEALVADPEVEAVYVATPHSEHLAHARLALAAGKHVLVEKAFARDAAQARELAGLVRESGLCCMEAMWSRFLPHTDVVRQAVASGLLGEVSTVLADHGQPLWPGGPRRLADPELAGGAMLDLGVYPLSFAAMVLGGIEEVVGLATPTDLGVDARVAFAVRGPSGALGSLSTDMSARTPTRATVCGTAARLELDGDFYTPTTVRLVAPDGDVLDELPADPDEQHLGLRHEACEVALRVRAGETESPLMPLAESVRLMEHMDTLLAPLRR